MTRILSLILSLIMTITSGGFTTFADRIVQVITGVPVSSSAVSDDFLADVSSDDVVKIDEGSGILKHYIIVYISPEASFFEKVKFFSSNGLALAGWYCPADMYVAFCAETKPEKLQSFCTKLMEENGIVSFASPVSSSEVCDQYIPDDPFSTEQDWSDYYISGDNWWLEATDAWLAWDYSAYFSKVRLGVVDSGVYPYHEDLENKVYFPSMAEASRNSFGSHSTHVAGIIGANHNNAIGIAGICDNCEMVFVDWQPNGSQFWISDLHILFGLMKTVKTGAKAINFSLGSAGNIKKSKGSDFIAKLDAMVYSAAISSLLSKGYDFVVIQSAGNGNKSGAAVDAFYNGTFCPITVDNAYSVSDSVSAQDIVDRIIVVGAAYGNRSSGFKQADFSDIGSQVSVAAPGVSIYSTDLTEEKYSYKSGTSMSAPMVTGIAGLVWSVNPDFTGAEVKDIICSSTCDVAAAADIKTYPELNYGELPMVNALLSVEEALDRTYQMGRVEGRFVSVNGDETVTLIQDGAETDFAVRHGGRFSFLAKEGQATIRFKDGDKVVENDIVISRGSPVVFSGVSFAAESLPQ